jgi:hypothetical protein
VRWCGTATGASPRDGTSDTMKTAMATSALFHVVALLSRGSANAEMNSQMASSVLR